MIPKIIHFVKPNVFQTEAQSWIDNYPEYKIISWDEIMITALIDSTFPAYVPFYKSLNEYHKVNFAKYIIMYVSGGLCVSPSFKCKQNLNDYTSVFSLIVSSYIEGNKSNFENFVGTGLKHFKPYIFDGVMGSTVYHPFWKDVIRNMMLTIENPATQDRHWLVPKSLKASYQSGPLLLGRVLNSGGWIQNTKTILIDDVRNYIELPEPKQKGLFLLLILASMVTGLQIWIITSYHKPKKLKYLS